MAKLVIIVCEVYSTQQYLDDFVIFLSIYSFACLTFESFLIHPYFP